MQLVARKIKNGWKWVVVAGTNAGSLDCAASSAVAEDAAPLGMTLRGDVIPCILAVAEEKWWEELRGDPKRLGEVSQAAFLLKARMLGFSVAIPWGDSDPNDFIVWSRDGGNSRATHIPKMLRVQVKGTGRLYRRGYEVQPVRSTRGQGKRRYTKKDIDVLVAHVQPADAWYVIPIEKVGRAKSLRLYPGIQSRNPQWEQWRDRWELLRVR